MYKGAETLQYLYDHGADMSAQVSREVIENGGQVVKTDGLINWLTYDYYRFSFEHHAEETRREFRNNYLEKLKWLTDHGVTG